MTVHGVRTLADVLALTIGPRSRSSAPKRAPAAAGAARGARRDPAASDDDFLDEYSDER
jgi:hypothetical protein